MKQVPPYLITQSMDFLDTKKEFRERILLFVGYVLIAIAITIATLILVYQAYGFNFNNNGTVVQNGLVFFSSQPNPAKIYVNNQLRPQSTNTRMFLADGIYSVKLTRSGYRTWKKTIEVDGGNVEHFDYPFLIPTQLATKKIQTYTSAPGLISQSPDQRWTLVEHPGSITDFDLYDMKDSAKPVVTTISLPTTILTKATISESLKVVGWSDDNQHVLLQHLYDGKSEFILMDRANPAQSVNLNTTLSISPSLMTLNNDKFDQYYVLDASGTLETDSLKTPATPAAAFVDHVLAYKSYASNTALYVTDTGAPAGKVLVKLKVGDNLYAIRSLPVSSNYLLQLTTYNGTLYVAVGSTSDSSVYIYEDPVGQLATTPNQPVVPLWVFHVAQPNYLSFSNNAQFIITENGSHYGVYDLQNNIGYSYSNDQLPVDSPQPHVSWMDGDRLTYVSNGKLTIEDYDNNNQQMLINANSSYLPIYTSDYKYVYSLSPPNAIGQLDLNQTALETPTDL